MALEHLIAFAALLPTLLVGHSLGDHVVQTDHQASGKTAPGWVGVRAMAGHLASYHLVLGAVALATPVLLLDLPVSPVGIGAGFGWSVLTHGLLDRRWPVRAILALFRAPRFAHLASKGINGLYLCDQALHHGMLLISALLIAAL